MEDNGVICMYPWVHFAYAMQGKIRPCCRFTAINEDQYDQNVVDNYQEAFGWLRKRMLYGVKTKACEVCYSQGENSMRTDANIRFNLADTELDEDFLELKTIEISLDNLCNLECKMCSSLYSSKLYKRDKLLNEVDPRLNGTAKKVPKSRINEILALNINWSKLTWVKILGGEPFMSPHFNKLLYKIIDSGDPINITLEIITNATHKLSQETIDLLLQFKEIKLTGSIDGAGIHNDYQRMGSNYKETIAQYAEYIEVLTNIKHPHIHTTFSVLNLNYLVSDMKYWEFNHPKWGVSFALVNSAIASNLSPFHCPDYYYEWLKDKLVTDRPFIKRKINEVLNLIKLKGIGFHKERWEGFKSEVKILDDMYNKKLEDYNPELYQLLKDNNEM